MTRADIIRMAREAGFSVQHILEPPKPYHHVAGYGDALERFAALVAAVEREKCATVAANTVCDEHLPTGIKIYGTRAAKAIRTRGEK